MYPTVFFCYFCPNRNRNIYVETTSKSTTPTNCIFSEPRCGPIGASISLSMPQCDVDVAQPIIDRRPSVSLFKWGGSQKRNDAPTPTAARQGLNIINQPIHFLSLFSIIH